MLFHAIYFTIFLHFCTSFKLRALHNQKLKNIRTVKSTLTEETCQQNEIKSEQNDIYYKDLVSKLKGTCVYIIGMMGSGKSTVGNIFAKNMGYRFLDTDDAAEYMLEEPIADFFAKGGEQEFRDLETKILMNMAQYTKLVISTGGGVILKQENWGFLRHGLVVFLDMTPEDIYTRLKTYPEDIKKRPLLLEDDPLKRLNQIYDDRIDVYNQADLKLKINPSATPEETSVQIAKSLLDVIAANPPLWETWKKTRNDFAIDVSARYNPSAVANAGIGDFSETKKGSITHINASDIVSGKVKLPPGIRAPDMLAAAAAADSDKEATEKLPKKGFGQFINTEAAS